MQWPRWTKKVPSRRSGPRREKPAHLCPFLPRIYRLEERRVLDISAAFSTATGHLELLLTNSAETAVISVTNGNITIHDSQQQSVAIDVDGAGPATVNASLVDSIQVAGDIAAQQKVVFDSPL